MDYKPDDPCITGVSSGRYLSKVPFDRFKFDPYYEHADKIYLERLRMQGRKRRYELRYAIETKFKHQPPNKWYGLCSTALLQVPETKRHGLLLDAGCGASPDCELAVMMGFKDAIGYDLWPDAGFHERRHVKFQVHDITGLFPIMEYSADVILSQGVLDLLTEPERLNFYKSCYKALHMGGILSVSICKLKRGHGFKVLNERKACKSLGFKVTTHGPNEFLAEVPGN